MRSARQGSAALRATDLRTTEPRTAELRTTELRTAELRTTEPRMAQPRTTEQGADRSDSAAVTDAAARRAIDRDIGELLSAGLPSAALGDVELCAVAARHARWGRACRRGVAAQAGMRGENGANGDVAGSDGASVWGRWHGGTSSAAAGVGRGRWDEYGGVISCHGLQP